MNRFLILLCLSSLLACSKQSKIDPSYQYEGQLINLILKDLFNDPESYTIELYRMDRPTVTPMLVATCRNTEVEMNKPQVSAKGNRFNVYYLNGYTFDRGNYQMKMYFSSEMKLKGTLPFNEQRTFYYFTQV